MGLYLCKTKDPQQNIKEDYIFCENEKNIYQILQNKNVHLIYYKKIRHCKYFISQKEKNTTFKEWFYFLHETIQSGISLIESLKILQQQTNKKYFKNIILQIIYYIEQGYSLKESIEKISDLTHPIIIQTISTYDKTENLSEGFYILYKHFDNRIKTIQTLYTNLRYPLFLILFFIIFSVFLGIYFIPEMISFLEDNKIKSDDIQAIVYVYNHFYDIVYAIGIFIFLIVLTQKTLNKLHCQTHQRIAAYFYKLPFLNIIQNIQIIRFFETFSILLQANIPIENAFEKAEKELSIPCIKNDFEKIKKDIINGQSLTIAFSKTLMIQPIFLKFLIIGEKSENIAKNILLCCKIQNQHISQKINTFIQYLQPTLILLIGFSLLWILKIFLLPLYSYLPEISNT